MIVLLYSFSVFFSLFMSFVMWGYEKAGKAPKSSKLAHVLIPFIPFVNIGWVFYKLL